jgi:putative MATE family efflux protein
VTDEETIKEPSPSLPTVRRPVRNLTEGSIWAALWALALPMATDQVFTSLTRLADVYFLGRLGHEALAASSLGGMVAFVVLSAVLGVAVAGLAVVARRVGADDVDGAAHALWQVLALATCLGLLFGGLGVASAHPLLRLLGAEGEVLRQGTEFLRVSFLFLALLSVNIATNRALRGAGEARTALWTMATGGVVTVLLFPLLISGVGSYQGMGIVGSAVASGIGQGVSWLLAMAMLASGRLRIRLQWTGARLDLPLLGQLLRLGLPVTGQLLLRSTARLLLAPLIAAFGAAALAAYGIMVRVMMLPLSVSFGLGNAAGTLVGQNLGAGKPRRAAVSAWLVATINVVIMTSVVLVVVLWAPEVVAFLVRDGHDVQREGVSVLRLMAPAYIFSALGVVMGRSLDGAGDTLPAMWINLVTLWLVQLPLAYLLAQGMGWGTTGIWLGIGGANVLNAIILAGWFLRGGWKKKEV